MKLIEINKATYRKNLNQVIIGFIITFLVLSLAFGAGLISTFSTVVETGEGDNFRYNFLGVFLGLLACLAMLNRLKTTTFFHEIFYVWQLKQIQNKVYRKIKKIKAASEQADLNALIILNFYYQSQKQVYLLDDNTLVISTLNQNIDALNELISAKQVTLSLEQFEKSMIASF
jgi:hypothetical protein